MDFNTTIAYAGVRYEVYWTSQYAEHILTNFPDPRHGVKHTEIVRILQVAGYVEKTKKRDFYVFVSEYEGTVFETLCLPRSRFLGKARALRHCYLL